MRTAYTATIVVSALLCSLLLSTPSAVGCFMYAPVPVQVWMDHIQVDITDQVAVKTYNCTFKNANPQAVVGGTCYMELEPGAQVDNMSVLIDGKEHKAEILDAEKAKKVFTDIVSKGGSPALLEYFGNQLIQTQVPRIAPNGTVTVKLQYTMVLPLKGDTVRLQMLNTNPKALMQPLKSASVEINIKSKRPIKNVYSPTHKITYSEKSDWDVSLSWKDDDYLPRHPFVLYYQIADDKVGASVVAHKERREEGAFMLMLSPTVGHGADAVSDADILPKDVVFCVDTSGSMLEASKMTQARGALKYCVSTLRKGDRFNIVDFSTTARGLSEDGLLNYNKQTTQQALEYIANLHARGGTAIEEALETSILHLSNEDADDDSRLKMIVFATDGLPTIGETDAKKLLAAVAKQNNIDARLFVFGEGYDVNTALLDFLALDHRGEADYILPDEDIQKKISRFFDRVGAPIMTDLKVDFGDLKVSDVYPRKVTDIYRGEQIVIYGRYRGGGTHTVTVKGDLKGGRRQSFTYELEFPRRSDDDKNAFVHRLWAGRKVDYLLTEIRKQPTAPDELVTEVTRLAKRYGIVTPYTSYLMTDDMIATPRPELTQQQRFRGGFAGPGLSAGGGSPVPASREDRQKNVAAAKSLGDLRRASSSSGALNELEEAAESAYAFGVADENAPESGPTGKRPSLAAIRHIGTRTFYSSQNVWYESDFDPTTAKIARTLKVGSDDYIELLFEDTRLAKFLALGDVVLRVNDDWLRIEG